MKFNCGPSAKEKHDAKKDWHKWFAWFPVRVSSCRCIWLETVERKGDYHRCIDFGGFWIFEYRELKS